MAEETYRCSVDWLWKNVLSKVRIPSAKPEPEFDAKVNNDYWKAMTGKDWVQPELPRYTPVYKVNRESYCTCGSSGSAHSGSDVSIGVEV